jgi:hypothetical protein
MYGLSERNFNDEVQDIIVAGATESISSAVVCAQ